MPKLFNSFRIIRTRGDRFLQKFVSVLRIIKLREHHAETRSWLPRPAYPAPARGETRSLAFSHCFAWRYAFTEIVDGHAVVRISRKTFLEIRDRVIRVIFARRQNSQIIPGLRQSAWIVRTQFCCA